MTRNVSESKYKNSNISRTNLPCKMQNIISPLLILKRVRKRSPLVGRRNSWHSSKFEHLLTYLKATEIQKNRMVVNVCNEPTLWLPFKIDYRISWETSVKTIETPDHYEIIRQRFKCFSKYTPHSASLLRPISDILTFYFFKLNGFIWFCLGLDVEILGGMEEI